MNKLEVVMYHYVRDLKNSRYPKIKGLDMELFKQQIAYLGKNYTFVGMQDVLAAVYESKKLPENAIMLSFDDGYIEHYTNVFPILANKGISGLFAVPGKVMKEGKVLDVNKIHFILASKPIEQIKKELYIKLNECRKLGFSIPDDEELYNTYAVANRFDSADTIFVKRILQSAIDENARIRIVDQLFKKFVTDNEFAFASELYLNMEQVKTMKKCNMFFGLHGYEHYSFDRLSEKEYKRDINSALDVFEGIIDRNHWVFAYPYGMTQEKLLSYCKSIHCVAGVTIEPKVADLDKINPLLIPRFDTNDYPPKVEKPKSKAFEM
ncbi:polysaccharide deacetylase family protein [Lachnospiraceae bacterium 54-11]